MSIPRYDKKKYYRIMDRTQSNFANQLKRLSRDSKRADSILIYYSMAIIIYSLSIKFYPHYFGGSWMSFSSIIMSIIVLIYSIINSKAQYPERIYKIQVALNEVKRLKREVGDLPDEPDTPKVHCGKLEGRDIAFQLEPIPQKDYVERLEQIKREYNNVVNGVEIRDDLDFYLTIVSLCKEHGLNPADGKYKKGETLLEVPPKRNDEREEETRKRKEAEEEQIIINEIRGYISENNPRLQWWHIWLNRCWHGILYAAPIVVFLFNFFFKYIKTIL